MYESSHSFDWTDGLLAVGLALVTVGVGLGIKTKLEETRGDIKVRLVSPTVTQGELKVVFDISGEVIKPGVYQLKGGSRIADALTAAGGLTANADREWVEKNINRAKRINDGEKIYIPKNPINSKSEIQNSNVKTDLNDQLISINNAGVEELDKLEGVGPALAEKIIEYREKNGGFKVTEELKLVSGIGDKLWDKIKEKVSL